MRFGKKTFIISVIAFILCLNVGFLSLTYYAYKHSLKSQQEVMKIQYESIAESFETTHEAVVDAGNGDHVDVLMQSFLNRYLDDGIYLAFVEDGEVLCSTFDEAVELNDENSLKSVSINGTRYAMISSEICGKYQMYFAVDASDIDADFNSVLIVFTLSGLAICVLFTLILYHTMGRSSALIDRTLMAVDKIADGDMSVDESLNAKGDLAVVASSFDNMCQAVNERIDAVNKNADEKQLMIDMLANQLSAPLADICRASEDILNQRNDPQDGAKRILKQASRLQNVSEKLIDIAVAREKALRIADVDVAPLLTDTASWLSRYARSIGISIETELSPMTLKADEELLSMLFYNLAENAVKACHSGCRVVLSCGDGVVTVSDNGSGMSEKQLEMITKPFYKAENESYKGNGSGLGLTLCKQIIDVHNATIKFESKQGYGTTVTVDFNADR